MSGPGAGGVGIFLSSHHPGSRDHHEGEQLTYHLPWKHSDRVSPSCSQFRALSYDEVQTILRAGSIWISVPVWSEYQVPKNAASRPASHRTLLVIVWDDKLFHTLQTSLRTASTLVSSYNSGHRHQALLPRMGYSIQSRPSDPDRPNWRSPFPTEWYGELSITATS